MTSKIEIPSLIPRTAQAIEPLGPTPTEVIARATEQAQALMVVVEARRLYQEIEGKKYLEVEAWQLIGAFNRVYAMTDWVRPIEREGQIVAYEARVSLADRDGLRVGAAEMTCGLDEFPCRGKEGGAKHKAARSAAQTWAESKAYRMLYGFVAPLAGYEPTPAAEMVSQGEKGSEAVTAPMGLCLDHNVPFVHRKGTSKKTGKPYDFWACPRKNEDGTPCPQRPQPKAIPSIAITEKPVMQTKETEPITETPAEAPGVLAEATPEPARDQDTPKTPDLTLRGFEQELPVLGYKNVGEVEAQLGASLTELVRKHGSLRGVLKALPQRPVTPKSVGLS